MPKRPTMADIAERAGVTRVAVSYALNDRPGVSDELRSRIKAIAGEMGFRVNVAAQVIHGSAAQAIGLAMRRPTPALSAEVFRRQFISGVQVALSARGYGLALQFADDLEREVEIYRRWAAEGRVDGVIVCDEQTADPRLPVLAAAGMPAVVMGPPPDEADGFSHVWSDERPAARDLVTYLHRMGHRHFARVTGPSALLHTERRTRALDEAATAAGLTQTVVTGDYTSAIGARLTRRILGRAPRPSALVYDNDLMALAGLGVATEMGFDVPGDISVLAWEDSPLCQVVRPALSVLQRDLPAFGMSVADALLRAIEEKAPQRLRTAEATLIIRGSTGITPGRGDTAGRTAT
jgi:DNA-binding LacI/PurR family transcriptional regulator